MIGTIPAAQFADVTVQAVDQNGKVFKTIQLQHQRVGRTMLINASDVAVEGYQLKDTPTKSITINAANNTISFKFERQVTTVEKENKHQADNQDHAQIKQKQLPQTGVNSTVVASVAGLILLTGIIGIWFKRQVEHR